MLVLAEPIDNEINASNDRASTIFGVGSWRHKPAAPPPEYSSR